MRNRHESAMRADVGRYNCTTFCTQYIDVAVVNSADAFYIVLEHRENFDGVRTGNDCRAETDLALRSQGSGGTVHRENRKKLHYYRPLLGERVKN